MSKNLILVLNCGSSSLKGAVLDNDNGEVLLSCLGEKLTTPDAYITFKKDGQKHRVELADRHDHTGAVGALLDELKKYGLDADVKAVGHRVVHGGEKYSASVLINDEVIAQLEACIPLAPLHNPANLTGIRAKPFSPACPTSPYSTPPSTKPCRNTPTPTPYRVPCIKNTPSAATVSTAPASASSLPKPPASSAKT